MTDEQWILVCQFMELVLWEYGFKINYPLVSEIKTSRFKAESREIFRKEKENV
jgi:hypothetical protein